MNPQNEESNDDLPFYLEDFYFLDTPCPPHCDGFLPEEGNKNDEDNEFLDLRDYEEENGMVGLDLNFEIDNYEDILEDGDEDEDEDEEEQLNPEQSQQDDLILQEDPFEINPWYFQKRRVIPKSSETIKTQLIEFHNNKIFPKNFSFKNMDNYFRNTKEHPFLKSLEHTGEIPLLEFPFNQDHYTYPDNRDDLFQILFEINFHLDKHTTKQSLEMHQILLEGIKIFF